MEMALEISKEPVHIRKRITAINISGWSYGEKLFVNVLSWQMTEEEFSGESHTGAEAKRNAAGRPRLFLSQPVFNNCPLCGQRRG